jgi:hypothetical protein
VVAEAALGAPVLVLLMAANDIVHHLEEIKFQVVPEQQPIS